MIRSTDRFDTSNGCALARYVTSSIELNRMQTRPLASSTRRGVESPPLPYLTRMAYRLPTVLLLSASAPPTSEPESL